MNIKHSLLSYFFILLISNYFLKIIVTKKHLLQIVKKEEPSMIGSFSTLFLTSLTMPQNRLNYLRNERLYFHLSFRDVHR